MRFWTWVRLINPGNMFLCLQSWTETRVSMLIPNCLVPVLKHQISASSAWPKPQFGDDLSVTEVLLHFPWRSFSSVYLRSVILLNACNITVAAKQISDFVSEIGVFKVIWKGCPLKVINMQGDHCVKLPGYPHLWWGIDTQRWYQFAFCMWLLHGFQDEQKTDCFILSVCINTGV